MFHSHRCLQSCLGKGQAAGSTPGITRSKRTATPKLKDMPRNGLILDSRSISV